jgi:hypothetical protein
MRFLNGTFLILVSTIWTSCNNQINFDSRKWKIEEDLRTYPFRETMTEDIIQNKKFIGLNLGQVRDSLGQPNALENGQLFYSITTDYGTDIDPIYTKDLVLTFDNDSLITNVKIEEWKK